MIDGLTFDPKKHEYRLDGRRIPGVTEVLVSAGLVDTTWLTEAGRDRGTFVHDILTNLDGGGEFKKELPDEMKGYVQAWQIFTNTWGVRQFLAVERTVAAEGLLAYAGRCDRIAERDGKRLVIEIKTGAAHAATGVQLAAYAHALPHRPGGTRLIGVHLHENGTYTVEEYKGLAYHATWSSALAIWYFKEKHKLNRR